MSDTVQENVEFDIEAQSSPLLVKSPNSRLSAAEERAPSSSSSSNFNPRKVLYRACLIFSAAEVFKSGINSSAAGAGGTRSSSSSSLYASVASPDPNPTHQDSGIWEEASAPEALSPPSASGTITCENINDKIVRKKNLQLLRDIGGTEEVKALLNTQLNNGISSPPHNLSQPYIRLFLATIFDSLGEAIYTITIFLLLVAATLSLAFGLTEDGAHPLGWLNGAILFFTILVVVICTTTKNCWEKLSNRKLLNSWGSKGRNMQAHVVRQGKILDVSESDLVVGDIAVLRKGDHVPADGLFLTGQALEIDEGLSKPTTIDAEHHPFLLYGSRVVNGSDAQMLVTSARMKTEWGERMSQAMEEAAENECKFASRLHKWHNWSNIAGISLSIFLVIVVFLRYKWGKFDDERRYRPDTKGEPIRISEIMNAIKEILIGSKRSARVLTTLLSISLIGVTEGMAFVVSGAIIIWGREILAHKALERDCVACLNMASVTTICTDKFGGLTEEETEIDKFYVGGEFVNESTMLASDVLECLFDGIGTQSLPELQGDCDPNLLLLASWAEARLGMKRQAVIEQCKQIREHREQCKQIPDHRGRNPFQECCQVVIEKNEGYYLHSRGPLQEILPLCSHQYCINGETQEMNERMRSSLEQISDCMKAEEAQVIAYACKRLDSLNEASASNSVFVGMVSLKDTKPEDTKRAVSTLREIGVQMVLLSGDDISVLRTIGEKYEILNPNSGSPEVLDAEVFRGWDDGEKMEKAEKIRIMGNCLPSDKTDLVRCLRKKGQVVAFLGQRVMDAPALKQAHVGIAVGTWSSTVAIESCDISFWEGNCFKFLVLVIEKARRFEENIRKLVQLQLIFTCSSSLINFIAIVFVGDAPMNAVEVFWLNLAVPLCGGLALLTRPSTDAPTSMVPVNSSEKVITKAMWRNMAVQVLYLTTIFLALQHRGEAILKGISRGSLKSMIYNGFFLCQMHITFISRELEKKNILRGVCHKSMWFWAGLILLLIFQAVSAGVEKVFGSVPGLSLEHWGWCLFIGLGCVLMDWVGKIVHDLMSLLVRMLNGSWEQL